MIVFINTRGLSMEVYSYIVYAIDNVSSTQCAMTICTHNNEPGISQKGLTYTPDKACVRVTVRNFAHTFASARVCVCVCDEALARVRQPVSVCVCLCACVCARMYMRVRGRVCVIYARVCACAGEVRGCAWWCERRFSRCHT